MNELTTIKDIDLLPSLSKFGVDVSKPDFIIFTSSEKKINELIDIDEREGKRALLLAVQTCLITYLNVDANLEANKMVTAEICKSIIIDYGDKIGIEQLMHAFNLCSRGKLGTDIDLTMYYGKINHKVFLDVLRAYCAKKYKVCSGLAEAKRVEGNKSTPATYQEICEIFFKRFLHEIETNTLTVENMDYYCTSIGKQWIKSGLVPISEDKKKFIFKNLKNKMYVKIHTVLVPKIDEEIGTIEYSEQTKKVPLQLHPDFKNYELEDIYTYLILTDFINEKRKQ